MRNIRNDGGNYMTPLFTLTTPNGQTIEGYEKEDNNGNPFYPLKHYNKDVIIPERELLNYKGQRTIDGKIILGTTSHITEEMAKEWGYKEIYFGDPYSAKDQLTSSIQYSTKEMQHKDLSNILLILIEHEGDCRCARTKNRKS